jgi:hypothetical protein
MHRLSLPLCSMYKHVCMYVHEYTFVCSGLHLCLLYVILILMHVSHSGPNPLFYQSCGSNHSLNPLGQATHSRSLPFFSLNALLTWTSAQNDTQKCASAHTRVLKGCQGTHSQRGGRAVGVLTPPILGGQWRFMQQLLDRLRALDVLHHFLFQLIFPVPHPTQYQHGLAPSFSVSADLSGRVCSATNT